MGMKFVFDLDGTVTRVETLPIMARHCGLEDQINELTAKTIQGNIPFIESFIQRVGILGQHSIVALRDVLADTALFPAVVDFISRHADDCIIATGNLDVWVEKLCERLPCEVRTSDAHIRDDRVVKLKSILKKEDVVRELQARGETVVFIGDGNNDSEAMRTADFSIASGLVHWPARSVMDVADFAVFDEAALVRLLEHMAGDAAEPEKSSVVLCCAGFGSRLGLNSTKALIGFEGKPHIHWQLQSFGAMDDVRVVVGFQASKVIEAAIEVRKDLIFALNHDYFSTGTGYSLFLGARFANGYVIAWDGDLIVHHEDLDGCLKAPGEYLGVSKAVSDDTVYVALSDDRAQVTGFSRTDKSAFEWSGPAKLRQSEVKEVRGNVFDGLIGRLPLPARHIRAFDIDTPGDYEYAKEHFRSYHRG
jgi:HAD superfamily phosphoserine phosphatase-like hydrolase